MSMLTFPAPQLEHYQITYNPVNHKVDILVVPNDVIACTCILYSLFHGMMDAGKLSAEEILYIAYQVSKETE